MKLNKVKELISQNGALIGLILISLVAYLVSNVFMSKDNLLNIARQVSINGIISIGMTLVILSRGIDLSVGSVVGFTSIFIAGIYYPRILYPFFINFSKFLSEIGQSSGSFEILVVFIFIVIIGGIIGLINGLVLVHSKIEPFIMTLCMMVIIRGLALLWSNGRPIYMEPEIAQRYKVIGAGYLGGVPVPAIIFGVLLLIFYIILDWTQFGRNLRAVGGNPEVAYLSGINTRVILVMVYVMASMLASVAGFVATSRTYTGEPSMGESWELDSIAAVVMGGTAFAGGTGGLGGTLIGVIIIGIINNILNLANVSSYFQYILKGLIILFAVLSRRRKK